MTARPRSRRPPTSSCSTRRKRGRGRAVPFVGRPGCQRAHLTHQRAPLLRARALRAAARPHAALVLFGLSLVFLNLSRSSMTTSRPWRRRQRRATGLCSSASDAGSPRRQRGRDRAVPAVGQRDCQRAHAAANHDPAMLATLRQFLCRCTGAFVACGLARRSPPSVSPRSLVGRRGMRPHAPGLGARTLLPRFEVRQKLRCSRVLAEHATCANVRERTPPQQCGNFHVRAEPGSSRQSFCAWLGAF